MQAPYLRSDQVIAHTADWRHCVAVHGLLGQVSRTTRATALGVALAVSVALGCPTTERERAEVTPGSSALEKNSAPPRDPPRAAAPREDVPPTAAVAWFDGPLREALAAARAGGTQVLLDFGADWCTACHELDEQVFSRPDVGAWLRERVVAVHVDAEKGEGPELVRRYRVSSYPTLMVVSAGGLELGRLDNAPVDAAALKDQLAPLLARPVSEALAEVEQAAKASPNAPHLRYRLAETLALASEGERAAKEYAVLVKADGASGRQANELAARALLDRAVLLEAPRGDTKAALETLDEYLRRYPDTAGAPAAFLERARLLVAAGREEEAFEALDGLVAANPGAPDVVAAHGWFCLQTGLRREPALDRVDAALATEPDERVELLIVRAELLGALGRRGEALASSREAAALVPASDHLRRLVWQYREVKPSE